MRFIGTPEISSKRRLLPSLITLLVVLTGTSPLLADKYFAHSAVGRLGELESKVRIVMTAQVETRLRGRRVVESSGRIRFFNTAGQARAVRVFGEGLTGQSLAEVSFEVGPGKLNAVFDIESAGGGLEQIWAQIVEEQGWARGTLTFQITELGQPVTDVSIFASEARAISVVPAVIRGADRTGLGVANPTSEEVTFFVVAVDSQENTLIEEVTLPPRGQTARFIDELFEQLQGVDFEGFLQVVSDRNLAAVALSQNETSADVSAIETFSGEESPVPLPMAAGSVRDLLADLVGSAANGQLAEALEALQVEVKEDGLIRSGTVTFRKGSQQIVVEISGDGSYVTPELEAGEWEVTVQAAGYCPMAQRISFPRPPLDREVISDEVINAEWFGNTLAPLGLLKPLRQFEFFFDRRGHAGQVVEKVREAFRLWAQFQLPELGIEVDEGRQVLGGRVQEGDPGASLLRKVTIRADATVGLDGPIAEVFGDPDTGECLGGLVRFHPQCESCPEQVAAQLWLAAFGRRPAQGDLSEFGLSNAVTQISATPQGFSPTPLDILYWTVAQIRPPLTLFSGAGEILPDEDPLPPVTQIGPSGEISENPPTLRWEAYPQATSYQVRLEDETTGTELVNQTVASTSLRVGTLDELHAYRWKVKAATSAGGTPWTPWMLFDYGNRAPEVSDQTFTIAENSPIGTAVGRVVATDPEGSPLTFEIVAGNSQSVFGIGLTSGLITVRDSSRLDFETVQQFTLIVRVTDPGGLSDDAVITIVLTDLIEDLRLSDMQAEVLELNSPICDFQDGQGFGTNYLVSAAYDDENGKVTLDTTALLDVTFLFGDGSPGQSFEDVVVSGRPSFNVEGDGFVGSLSFTLCIRYEVTQGARLTLTIVNTIGVESNEDTVTLSRPEGAN